MNLIDTPYRFTVEVNDWLRVLHGGVAVSMVSLALSRWSGNYRAFMLTIIKSRASVS